MKRSLAPILSLLVVALFCASSKAQVTTAGSISGSVTDPTGAVVASATIVVKNNETGVENTTTTSENGTFTIAQLPRGTYTLTVQATSGFKKSEVTKVSVNVGTPTTGSFPMSTSMLTTPIPRCRESMPGSCGGTELTLSKTSARRTERSSIGEEGCCQGRRRS